MPECVRSEIKLFADDSLLYRRKQNNADCCQLQEDLDKLQEWEQKWQMAFNADKCEVIRITNKKRPLCSDYFIQNQKLALRTEAKYVGVTIGSDLSWSRHPANITKKANSTMGFLKRNIRSAPQAVKESAYKTFVRPIVEYAATTWAPFTDTETRKIEKVQRRAARFGSNDYRRTSSVTEMISTFGWDTLQKRRYLARLSMMYRIVHHLVDIPVEPYLTPLTSMTRGHDSRFFQYPDVKHNLPTELLPKNLHLVEPTPSDCTKPDNAGGLPEPAGHPYLLNATPILTGFNHFNCCTYLFYPWRVGILCNIARILKY